MAASRTNYPETIRFGLRYVIAWAIVIAAGMLIIWSFAGYHEKLARVGWGMGMIGLSIGVAFLIAHLTRSHALAGYCDARTLGSRHERILEFPCGPEEALEIMETALRSVRTFDTIDINRKALTFTARLRNVDRYSMEGSSESHNLVKAALVAGDDITRATLRFEPDRSAFWDVLLPDNGRNLDNALTVTALLEDRIAEHRRSTRQLAERTALEKQLAEAQLKLLQAQVEPHFLYNTLANAQLLTRSDPARADRMLGHLIDFLRSSLPQPATAGADAEMSTLGQEVERSRAYLEILKIRMGDRLRVEIDLPEVLGPVALPPLMLQTLVENAIKHGLEPKPGGGTLWIRANRSGDLAKVSVADDGVGFQEGTAGTGLGLKNVRDRLKLLFGERGTLSLATNFPAGVTATLVVPITRDINA
ncbi:MAG: sensor histidine kinase [Betaproteobacteria bacterium]|nr:sensor histidine kinase [Betaproteobacteria bacterium]